MSDIGSIAREIASRADSFAAAAIEEWKQSAQVEKWQSVPNSYTFDSLPELVRALARAALLEPDKPDAQRHLIEIAVKHGVDRFQEGFDEPLIYREYQMLRNAIWGHIRILHGAAGAGAEAIIRIDAVTTSACRGSLVGFHRPQLEAQGRFELVFEALLKDWPRLGH